MSAWDRCHFGLLSALEFIGALYKLAHQHLRVLSLHVALPLLLLWRLRLPAWSSTLPFAVCNLLDRLRDRFALGVIGWQRGWAPAFPHW